MEIKLIAMDLDGTLLGSGEQIPEKNMRALRECERRGIKLMFSSGRSFESIAGIARSIAVNPIISSVNGARVDMGISGETICELPMGRELSLRVYEILSAADVYFMSFTRGHTYMHNLEAGRRVGKHIHEPGVSVRAGHRYEMVADPERVLREGTASPYKYVVFGDDYDPILDCLRGELSSQGVSISSSWRDNLEIMCEGVDKGASLRLVAERLGISLDCVMAFGDNTNDVPMFECAGYPVAMDNAEDCAKQAARLFAPACHIGGVGKMIEELVLCKPVN